VSSEAEPHEITERLLAVSSPQFSVDETIEILRRLEKSPYEDEAVNQLQHAHPFFEETAQLRYWDDCSKDGRAQTDELQSYVEVLKNVWVSADDDV
jgi:predicted HD phosphohydrolase